MRTNLEIPKTNVPPKIVTPERRIITQEGLFTLLWNQLDHLEPRIAIDMLVVELKDEFFELLNEERFIDFRPIYWQEMFESILWTEQADSTAHRCGKHLLLFMGCLGDAIEKNGGARIPKARAIEMMIECWSDAHVYLRFHSTPTRSWVETTPLGVETLGVSICVELSNNMDFLADDLFDLSVPFE